MDTRHLRMAREARGLSQEQLAKAIAISQQMYNGYERGKHEPSIETLRRLSLALDVSADYLLGINPTCKPLTMECDLSGDEAELLFAFRSCPLDMQRVVLATAQAAAASVPLVEPGNRDAAEANTA